jgi:hypothetical protein
MKLSPGIRVHASPRIGGWASEITVRGGTSQVEITCPAACYLTAVDLTDAEGVALITWRIGKCLQPGDIVTIPLQAQVT